jgi:hypothetical protein
MQKKLLKITCGIMLGLSALVLYLSLNGCAVFGDTTKLQAQLDANKAQIIDLQAKNDAANAASKLAYDQALATHDMVTASIAEKQLAGEARDKALLSKVEKANQAAQFTLDATSGNEQGFQQGLSTLGGLLPPPFGTLAVLAASLGFGIWKTYRANQVSAGATEAIAAITSSNDHVLSGATQLEVNSHDATLASGLSLDAKKLWDGTPDSAALPPAAIVAIKNN